MRNFLAVLLLIVIPGCASGVGSAPPPAGITVANSEMVSNCKYVSDVYGTSPFYGVFLSKALPQARQAAMQEAVTLGATHVVFTSTSTGYGSTSVSGQAYRC
jgi:O-acetyl-ADP-ribose deacetylase (regulator of RNase III)